MSPELLRLAMAMPEARAQTWAGPMAAAWQLAEINSVERASAWLGQIGHETGSLRWVQELWGPTPQQRRYEPRTTLSARLGNLRAGDGFRYRGRGAIQTTGRDNYARTRDRMRKLVGSSVPDFVADPALVATPEWACLTAASYWIERGLNRFADAGDQLTLTKRINGGTNGLADRLARTASARAACLLEGI